MQPHATAHAENGGDPTRQQTSGSSADLLHLVETLIAKEKGEEIVIIPLQGKSTIADHMVIASGRSTRQVAAIADKLAEEIKKNGFTPPKIEGKDNADWVLLDAGDVIVHIFRPEVREFYQIEKIWDSEAVKRA